MDLNIVGVWQLGRVRPAFPDTEIVPRKKSPVTRGIGVVVATN